MPRKKANIHYLYKTTCVITGRYYIGMHSTNNLEDGYMGSGKRLRYSIRKYGVENHVKEILEFFDSRELLIEAECKLVNSDLIKNERCMNLKEGGTGGLKGLPVEILSQISKAGNEKLKWLRENDEEWRLKRSVGLSLANKKVYDSGKRKKENVFDWTGKKHSAETKNKIRQSMTGKNIGSKNSQFGSMWITDGVNNKKIKVDETIPNGWYKGRTIK